MMKSPLVSVVIPAYGVAPFIAETMQSVVDQSHGDWEAIVVNDGSPDTPELERALAPFMDRIRYITQRNQGAAVARNAAMKVARGEWLAFIDGDDCWLPMFLQRQLQLIDRKGLDMVWCDGIYFGETSHVGQPLSTLLPNDAPVTLRSLIAGRINVNNSGTVVRRSLVEAVGYSDELLRRGQDFDLWARLLARGMRAEFNPEPLFRYRVRAGSLTGDMLSQVERDLSVLQRLREKAVCGAGDAAFLEERLAELRAEKALITGKRRLADRDYAGAAAEFRLAVAEKPSMRRLIALAAVKLAPALVRRVHLRRTRPEHR